MIEASFRKKQWWIKRGGPSLFLDQTGPPLFQGLDDPPPPPLSEGPGPATENLPTNLH